ncbi:MAG: lysoplasmalogenase [Candidatus Aminicenantes bacterium]|nr:lysoplasmalogenase [Candidatus Aminicenantes bacterium]
MSLDLWLAVLVISISAAFSIWGRYQKTRFIHYAFKPLTMILIISLAWERVTAWPSFYGYFILSGLCISFLGDILLMLPQKYFRSGLLAFLAAQVLYILAFSRDLQTLSFFPLPIVLAYGAVVYLFLFGALGKYRWPVLGYITAISAMAWLAFNRHLNLLESGTLLALVGAGFFLFSDTLNAVNRFKSPFRPAQVLILGTYFAAQLLFALSI